MIRRRLSRTGLRESRLRNLRLRRRLRENSVRRRSLRRRLMEDVEEDDVEEECYFIEQAIYYDVMAACKRYVDPEWGFDIGYMPQLCEQGVKTRGSKFEADILNVADFLEDIGRGEVEEIKEAVLEGIKDAIKKLRGYLNEQDNPVWRTQKFYLDRIADILEEPSLRI